jgi:hypothetical protein
MLSNLFSALFPIIVGAVTTPIYDGLQKGIKVLVRLPPPITRILVGVTSAGIYALGAKGLALTGSSALTVTSGDVGIMTAAGLSYLFKLTQKVQPLIGPQPPR